MLFDRSCTHALAHIFSVSCCSLERGTTDRACIVLRELVHLSVMFLPPPCVSPCIRVQISVSCCPLAPVVALCAHACIRVQSSVSCCPLAQDAPPRDRNSLQLRKRASSVHASQRTARQTRRSPKGTNCPYPPWRSALSFPARHIYDKQLIAGV